MDPHVIQIKARQPFSFRECLWFLNRNLDDCMHRITGTGIRKVICICERPLVAEIMESAAGVSVHILNATPDAGERADISGYVSGWLDTERDLRPFYRLLKAYSPLAYMATAFRGLRLIRMPDLFETMAWAVIGQQINLSFAYKLKRRLVEKYGTVICHEETPYYLFPAPAVIAGIPPEDLRALQFSAGKAAYLIGIARAFARNEISKEQLLALPDLNARQEMLLGIKGVGAWTANYTLMKCAGEPSCIPYGDAGLHQSLKAHGIIKDKSETEEILRLFDRFKGWESYLVFYLWRSLAMQQ